MAAIRPPTAIDGDQTGFESLVIGIASFILGIVAHGLRPMMFWRGVHLEMLASLAAATVVTGALAFRYRQARPARPAVLAYTTHVIVLWSTFVLGWRITAAPGEDFEAFARDWLPKGVVVAICGVLLLLMLKALSRSLTFGPTRCPSCGYSLVGLPDQRCPECGRPFTLDELGVGEHELKVPPSSPRSQRS